MNEDSHDLRTSLLALDVSTFENIKSPRFISRASERRRSVAVGEFLNYYYVTCS